MKIKSFFKISFIFAFFILLVSFVACKTPSPKINMTYSASFGGEIVGEANQIIECGASGTEVTAQAYEGYEFVEWSDGVTTVARMDENVQADITVTAKFEKLTYTVSYSSDENGAIQGKANQTVVYGSDSTTVTAIPNEGYEFVKWSDGISTATRSDKNIRTNIQVKALFEKLYIVSYTTDGNGKIVGETNQTVVYGSNSATVTAKPNYGYKFVGWTDGITTAERTDENIQSNINVTAMFEKLTYTVSYSTDGNGTIQGEANQTVDYGDSATSIKAIPNEGYRFVGWTDGVTTAERADENVQSNITVTAKFEKLIYTVNYSSDGNGKIKGEANQTVEYGCNSTTVTAIANEGYKFAGWTDGLTTAERAEKDVQSNITVMAMFEKIIQTQAFIVSYITDGNGTIQGEADQTVEFGKNATPVTAVPNEGFKFYKWTDGITTATRTDENIQVDRTVTARFKKLYKVSYIVVEGGTIQGESNQTVEYGSNSTTVTAIPNEGYRFVGWSDGITTAARIDENVQADITVTAKFEKLTYIVSYSTDGNGTIQGKANQTVEYGCNSTTVTAIPNEGYKFVGWSDGVTTAVRVDENVQADITVIALFEKLYKISYIAFEGGTIQGEASQFVESGSYTTPVTAIPNEGYRFVGWSDGVTTAERTDLNIDKNLTVAARFNKLSFKIQYASNNTLLGSIYFVTSAKSSVSYGEDGPKLKAIPSKDIFGKSYVFMYWSDGVLTAERQDINVTTEINVVAYFGYSAEYKVNGNVGGRIEGDVSQAILPNEISKEVVAVPDDGYVFAGWSDVSLEFKRQDTIYYDRNIEVLAYFEPIEKTFSYDYGIASGKPTATQITLNRNDIQSAEFIVPTYSGYSFCGWYADKEYRTQVVNETGRYMYGYAAFSLETVTLYAKWQKEGEEIDTHKILLVFVDEVQTELYSSKLSQNVKVHSKMSALDYEMSKLITKTIYSLLTDWFEDNVIFEVNAYFTTTIVSDGFSSGLATNGHYDYHLFANGVSEISDLLYVYNNILVTASLSDYSNNLHSSSGVADVKEAFIPMEEYWASKIINHESFVDYLNKLESGEHDIWDTVINTYIHEFVHTVEKNFNIKYDLHSVLSECISSMYVRDIYKQYLTNKLLIKELYYGIPEEYWTHNHEVRLNYVAKPIDGRSYGKIVVIGEDDNRPAWITYITRSVHYGSDLSVEAVPDEGYRFVKWSDGVTTAIRHDKNIISCINVEAIFEKI